MEWDEDQSNLARAAVEQSHAEGEEASEESAGEGMAKQGRRASTVKPPPPPPPPPPKPLDGSDASGGASASASANGSGTSPPHKPLDAFARQRHMELWTSRQSIDRWMVKRAAEKTLAQKLKTVTLVPSTTHELSEADPNGFAYGGVHPGTLHAHGRLHKASRVATPRMPPHDAAPPSYHHRTHHARHSTRATVHAHRRTCTCMPTVHHRSTPSTIALGSPAATACTSACASSACRSPALPFGLRCCRAVPTRRRRGSRPRAAHSTGLQMRRCSLGCCSPSVTCSATGAPRAVPRSPWSSRGAVSYMCMACAWHVHGMCMACAHAHGDHGAREEL